MKKILLIVAIFFVSNAVGGGASAALITNWSFDIDAAFYNSQPGDVSGTNPVDLSWDLPSEGNLENAPKTLLWGTPSNPEGEKSALTVTGVTSGSMVIVGGTSDFVNSLTFTHDNEVISGAANALQSLTGGSIKSTLRLYPTGVDPDIGDIWKTFSTDLSFTFKETTNITPNTWPYYYNSDSSSYYSQDYFILTTPLATETFTIEDYTYTVSFDELSFFDDPYRIFHGISSDARGWTTVENDRTTLITKIKIAASPVVPEPSTVLLLGLGLLGCCGIARKRAN